MSYGMTPREMEGVYKWDIQYLYSKFYSRYCLSYKNAPAFRDEHGVFFYFSIHETCKIMCCGRQKAENLHKKMVSLGFIERRKPDVGKGYKIYLKKFIGFCTEIPHKEAKQQRTFLEIMNDVCDRLEIEHLCQASPINASLYHEIMFIVTELYNSKESVYISNQNRSIDDIHAHLDMLTPQHIEQVADAFCAQTHEIKNIRSYLQTSLYNSVSSHHSYYVNQVKADQG